MMLDTLIALVEQGPLWDGDVPSKVERDTLIEQGLAVRIVFRGQDGYTAATYRGRDAYNQHYGGDTLASSMDIRKTKRLMKTV
jgi:hypothetical protein